MEIKKREREAKKRAKREEKLRRKAERRGHRETVEAPLEESKDGNTSLNELEATTSRP